MIHIQHFFDNCWWDLHCTMNQKVKGILFALYELYLDIAYQYRSYWLHNIFLENWLLSSVVCRDCKLFRVMDKGSDYTQTWCQKIYKSESHSPAADRTLLTPLSGRSSTETTDMFAIRWNRFIRFLSFRGSISSFMMQKMSSDSDSSSHDRLSCNRAVQYTSVYRCSKTPGLWTANFIKECLQSWIVSLVQQMNGIVGIGEPLFSEFICRFGWILHIKASLLHTED